MGKIWIKLRLAVVDCRFRQAKAVQRTLKAWLVARRQQKSAFERALQPMAYYANPKSLVCAHGDSQRGPDRHQEKLIEGLVSSGRYQNASEVLREGLRLVERRESEDKARLKSLRDAARLGIADIEAGRFRDFSAETPLQEHLEALAQNTVRQASKR